ncbi:hypothetical protein ACFLZL_05595 [Thermodesulfobacteriota bacterium]
MKAERPKAEENLRAINEHCEECPTFDTKVNEMKAKEIPSLPRHEPGIFERLVNKTREFSINVISPQGSTGPLSPYGVKLGKRLLRILTS